MLAKIFLRYSTNETVYKEYLEKYNFVIKTLKKRNKLTEIYLDTEIKKELDNSMDVLITIRELQRQLEKLLISIDKDKKIQVMDNYLQKEQYKLSFESDAKHYIDNYKVNNNKKTLTIEEKKTLFRCFYKEFYSSINIINSTFDEWLEYVKDEKNEMLNIRTEAQNWHNILKKVLYGN